ncbi:MAG: hypothetical protein JWM95_3684 [Gemmatimonadetes bacterium]|nr:hypothetical protein [Gemmatimonadota bacterium]
MSNSKRVIAIGATAVVATILASSGLVSRTFATVPALSVRIVDSVGTPVAGACVSESWLHNSFEPGSSHWEEGVTNRDGQIVFPARYATATVFRRVVVPMVRRFQVHSSVGANAVLIAATPHHVGEGLYKEGGATSLEIALRRDDMHTCPNVVSPTL